MKITAPLRLNLFLELQGGPDTMISWAIFGPRAVGPLIETTQGLIHSYSALLV